MTGTVRIETIIQSNIDHLAAAAGGTGLFAVQLAKLAGNHVIGTCSSDDKAAFLKSIGCDRVVRLLPLIDA